VVVGRGDARKAPRRQRTNPHPGPHKAGGKGASKVPDKPGGGGATEDEGCGPPLGPTPFAGAPSKRGGGDEAFFKGGLKRNRQRPGERARKLATNDIPREERGAMKKQTKKGDCRNFKGKTKKKKKRETNGVARGAGRRMGGGGD